LKLSPDTKQLFGTNYRKQRWSSGDLSIRMPNRRLHTKTAAQLAMEAPLLPIRENAIRGLLGPFYASGVSGGLLARDRRSWSLLAPLNTTLRLQVTNNFMLQSSPTNSTKMPIMA
jgi:hypothetical protein